MSSSVRNGPSAFCTVLAVVLAGISFAVLLAGCGAARPTHASSTSGGRRAKARESVNPIPLTERFVGTNWFPGLYPILMPLVIHSAKVWEGDWGLVGPELNHAAGTLKRLGFIAAARQTLAGQGRSSLEVFSLVMEFHSVAGARAELGRARLQPRGPGVQPAGIPVHRFRVAAIPGARGAETFGPFIHSRSIAFMAGPFDYQVVVLAPSGAGQGPSRKQLIEACAALWREVRRSFST